MYQHGKICCGGYISVSPANINLQSTLSKPFVLVPYPARESVGLCVEKPVSDDATHDLKYGPEHPFPDGWQVSVP